MPSLSSPAQTGSVVVAPVGAVSRWQVFLQAVLLGLPASMQINQTTSPIQTAASASAPASSNAVLPTAETKQVDVPPNSPTAVSAADSTANTTSPTASAASVNDQDLDSAQASANLSASLSSAPATILDATPPEVVLDAISNSIDEVVNDRQATSKESFVASNVVEQPSNTVVEVEASKEKELAPEVEAYLQEVVDHTDKLPEEIVITDDGSDITTKPYPTQKVVVLPITSDEEQKGKWLDTKSSLRWLVEFSKKIINMFAGQVIYYQEDNK